MSHSSGSVAADRLPGQLAGLLDELGLDPHRCRLTRRPARGAAAYLCLPAPDRPQLLVPERRWAGPMLVDRRARGTRGRLAKQGLARALGTGILGRLPVRRLVVDDPRLDELATWLTDSPGAVVGVLTGPPRANRKPVLRVFTSDGTTIGYAKVGATALAAELVRHEARALADLAEADLATLRVPRVVRSGSWRGRDLLLTSPLAAVERQPSRLPVAATRTLFGLHATQDRPLGASSVFTVGAGSELTGPAATELHRLAGRLEAALGDRLLPLGAAHGDWTPWNMAWTDGVLEVWDWERFATDLPAGHDVIHFEASRVQAADPSAGEQRLLTELPDRLAECGLDPGLTHELLALYLLVIGRRYAADLTRQPAASVSTRLDWVVRLLRAETDRVAPAERRAAR